MTDVVNLVSYDEIRAVLGVDDEDLSNVVLAHFNLDLVINVDLNSWFPNWADLIAKDPQSSQETLQQSALQLYLKYLCAYEVLISANFKFLQRKSDGEVESHRFKEDALETLRDEFEERLNKHRNQVVAIDTEFLPAEISTGRVQLLRRGAPNTDVVTD